MTKEDKKKKEAIVALKRLAKSRKARRIAYQRKQWYTVRSLLGNDWAHWFFLLGARERGKSYSVQDYCLNQKINHDVPFYWIRLNEASTKKMLSNKGARMFEPLLFQKYNMQDRMTVKGDFVYLGDEVLCQVYALSTAHNLKGSALYNAATFKGCNIIIDEFQFEVSQRRTFSVMYQLKMLIENICRSSYENVRIFMIANTTEECAEVLSEGFNFIPLDFGVYKLRSRKCVIDYIPNTEAYDERRKTALANELEKNQSTGNFTNKIERDFSLVYKGRLHSPTYIIKFSKDEGEWFTVWDGNIIAPYNGEKKQGLAMRRYIDDRFDENLRNQVIGMSDSRAFKFKNMITQTRFNNQLGMIKKQ